MCQLHSQAARGQQVQSLDQVEGMDVQGTRTPGLRLSFSTVK
jgi:hypothetical protein